MVTKERYIFIDILKGITILMIVCGHIIPGSIQVLGKHIMTFHMPLFFFVSGILYNEEKYGARFGAFIKERTKGLIVPYIMFSIIVAVGYYSIENNYREFICNLLTKGWGGYALWFVPVLFLVELLYYPLSWLRLGSRCLLLLGTAVISYYSSFYVGMAPYNALLVFCGLWFYGIGNLLRPHLKKISSLSVKSIVLIIISGVAFSLLYLPITDIHPSYFINKIPSWIYYLSPLFATFGLIGVSILIERYMVTHVVRFLSTCGKQSYIILAFHQIIVMILGAYLPSKITIASMIIILSFLVWFIPKYMPWMLGKK